MKRLPDRFVVRLGRKDVLFEVADLPISRRAYGYYITHNAGSSTDIYFSFSFIRPSTLANFLTHKYDTGRVVVSCYNPPTYFKEEK